MSKLLAEFISNLAAKAGLKADDAELLELVQNKALAIDIPDTLVNALEQNIHSLQSAESKIKNKLKAEIYNGLDAEFDRMMDDAGMDDAVKSEFSSKKFDSSIKRAVAISNKISELTTKSNSGGKDSQKYIEEINKLKSDLSALIFYKSGCDYTRLIILLSGFKCWIYCSKYSHIWWCWSCLCSMVSKPFLMELLCFLISGLLLVLARECLRVLFP